MLLIGEWTKDLPKKDMNIIVMEGVLEYFSKDQVKTCLNMLCDRGICILPVVFNVGMEATGDIEAAVGMTIICCPVFGLLFGNLLYLISEGLDSGTESLGWLMLYLVCALTLTDKKRSISSRIYDNNLK